LGQSKALCSRRRSPRQSARRLRDRPLALGWKKFRERIKAYGSIPFAIETSQGAAVEQLLEAGMEVYPLNPKSAQAYRQRKAPSGVKDDQLDAWSFADALRVDEPFSVPKSGWF
jgi:hypothetical protein